MLCVLKVYRRKDPARCFFRFYHNGVKMACALIYPLLCEKWPFQHSGEVHNVPSSYMSACLELWLLGVTTVPPPRSICIDWHIPKYRVISLSVQIIGNRPEDLEYGKSLCVACGVIVLLAGEINKHTRTGRTQSWISGYNLIILW